MPDQRVVLITGASSGVGQSTARLLSQRGYKVFGTSRHSTAAKSTPPVDMLSLDVRADDSVRACVQAVVNRSGRLDVLINNAGYELAGAVEELSLEEARAQFESCPARRRGALSDWGTSEDGGALAPISPAGMYEYGVRRNFSI
jgi:NAD(P)-dependent dehydrogenase (short-subunit alcohol dehydrogenase family)